MSAGYTSQPLVVQPWCNHAETTVGYINGKGSFMPLADCSIGPGYAVDYEPLARLLASAPDLLAERNQLKALNVELVEALESARQAISSMKTEAETAAMGDEQMWRDAAEAISDEGLEADMAIRAALAKHKGDAA